MMLSEDLILYDDIRYDYLIVRVLLYHIMVACVDTDHAFVADHVEFNIIYTRIRVRRDPAVLHLSDSAVAELDGRQVFIDRVYALTLQYTFTAYAVYAFYFIMEEPAQGIQAVAPQEPQDRRS